MWICVSRMESSPGICEGGTADVSRSANVHDAKGLLAFPGAVDAHTHIAGIYQDMELDMFQESKCAAQGGVTTVMPYIRSGQCYMWEGGAYKDLYPKFLQRAEKAGYHCDYAYHVSPIEGQHIEELEWLIKEQGVVSLGEVFMFTASMGCTALVPSRGRTTFSCCRGRQYDLGHYDFVLRELGRIAESNPELADLIQIGFHCETPELLAAWTKKIQGRGDNNAKAWSDARPTHSEAWPCGPLHTSLPRLGCLM